MAPPALEPMVDEIGHPFTAGDEPPEREVGPIREQLPTATRAEASILGNRELFGRLAATAMLPSVTDVVASWTPDLIVRDPCEYASAVVAGTTGTAVAQAAIGAADVEWSSIDVAAPALEAHRRGLVAEVRATPYLTRFPPSLDPSPFPATRRYSEPRPGPGAPLPEWWGGSDAPLVYVSFGTVLGHMSIAADAYRTVLAAVADLDVRVLLTVGRRFDAAQLGDLPDNVHVEAWVEQADALAAADLVVCHGGSGTTYGALAAGLPLVIVPMFADQFVNARTVAAAGAGVAFERAAGLDPAAIAAAIGRVRRASTFRVCAERIAAEMADAPPLAQALRSLVG